MITAVSEGKKATVGKELKGVPESVQKKLFGKKKKALGLKIKVEPIGNAFKISEIYV